MTEFEKGFSYGFIIGSGQGGGGGGTVIKEKEVPWKYPDHWKSLPNAKSGEIYLLAYPTTANNTIKLSAVCSENQRYMPSGYGVSVNWDYGGSGSSDIQYTFSAQSMTMSHKYTNVNKQHVIKITAPSSTTADGANMAFIQISSAASSNNFLAVCAGEDTFAFNYIGSFNVVYAKIMHKDINATTTDNSFSDYIGGGLKGQYRHLIRNLIGESTTNNCRRIDFAGYPTSWASNGDGILNGTHLRCVYGLEKLTNYDNTSFFENAVMNKISLDSITKFTMNSFRNSDIMEVYAPKCTEFGENAFLNCTQLKRLTVKKGCTVPDYISTNNPMLEIRFEE